jgi:hypothetical protein
MEKKGKKKCGLSPHHLLKKRKLKKMEFLKKGNN